MDVEFRRLLADLESVLKQVYMFVHKCSCPWTVLARAHVFVTTTEPFYRALDTPVGIADALRTFLVMLAPACPHISSELWTALSHLPAPASIKLSAGVLAQPWPAHDSAALCLDTVDLAVQVRPRALHVGLFHTCF